MNKLKILYAIGKRHAGGIQLNRFLDIAANNYNVKIAAFNNSIGIENRDWSLDALLSAFAPNLTPFENNKNYEIYYEQVKRFNPDLIISDLELFTSYIGNILNKPVWQVSPNILHFATPYKLKYKMKIFGKCSAFLGDGRKNQRIQNVIINSEKRFVCSHFGDANKFELMEGYEWIRPYHVKGKISKPCNHNLVSSIIYNDKKLIALLNKHRDVILFSNFVEEKYSNLTIKNISEWSEYECNLKNCNMFVNQGYADFLADAFYNEKCSIVMPNFNEFECLLNSIYSEHFGLSKTVYDKIPQSKELPNIHFNYNPNIKYLHQKIEETFR